MLLLFFVVVVVVAVVVAVLVIVVLVLVVVGDFWSPGFYDNYLGPKINSDQKPFLDQRQLRPKLFR